ncbi:MAG: hypothetical protein ACXWQO_14400 [Bdellovibrionota bacterium]
MKTVLLAIALLSASVAYAKTTKHVERDPANALTIDLTGSFISPAHDPAAIELEGDDLKTHLMSRFSGKNGKPTSLKVKATCETENKCLLELSQ